MSPLEQPRAWPCQKRTVAFSGREPAEGCFLCSARAAAPEDSDPSGAAAGTAVGAAGAAVREQQRGWRLRAAAQGGPGRVTEWTARHGWHCVSQCARIAPEEERLSPELFSREDSLPPCFRLLSTERRSEWKPSPNMTSKLLLTMS